MAASTEQVLDLIRKARSAQSKAELQFLLVNQTHALAPYRQAALWVNRKLAKLSGVVKIESNGPYAQWLSQVYDEIDRNRPKIPVPLTASHFPSPVAKDWAQWFPEYALWVPLPTGGPAGGLLLAREAPFLEHEVALLTEWVDAWQHAYQHQRKALPLLGRSASDKEQPQGFFGRIFDGLFGTGGKKLLWGVAILTALGFVPVPLTVLAPAEIVPANPELIRAPLEGVIDRFYVQPNDPIKKGQPLFSFDERLIKSRLEVSIQSLGIAEAEYRQAAQLALSDNQAKLNLANLAGQIQERRVEVAYIRDQLSRSQVTATRDGIALLDDPSAWIGRPVAVGEQVMRIAALEDKEIEAWISISDLIPIEPQNPVQMYLNANPLRPLTGTVRYLGYDPVTRPDGTLAYRLRAKLVETSDDNETRIGARGTVKIEGPTVLAAYWVLRRPWSALQSHLGI